MAAYFNETSMRRKVTNHVATPPPNRIRELRLRAGMTQQEVGKVLGVSHACVNRWERQVNAVSTRQLNRLATLFRVHPGELLAPMPREQGLTQLQLRLHRMTAEWDDDLLDKLVRTAEWLHETFAKEP
jgi:transcriptional regulator with XRE-family HTH domain